MARTAATYRAGQAYTPSKTNDVTYTGSIKLDVWDPGVSGRPTLAVVHGGAWAAGDKADEDMLRICSRFAELGFCVVSANHTLDPADPQTPITEMDALITWLRANAATYNGATDKVAVLGLSSGAHLLLMAAIGGAAPDALVAWSPACDLGALTGTSATRAEDYMNVPYVGNEAAWEAKSPTDAISAAICPIRIVGSTNDASIEITQNTAFVTAAQAAGQTDITSRTFPDAVHADFGQLGEADDVLETAAWLMIRMPWTVSTLTRTAASGRSAASGRAVAT